MMGKRPGEEEGPGGELRSLTWASEAPRGGEHWKAWDGLTEGTPCEVGECEVARNVGTIRDLARSLGTRAPDGGLTRVRGEGELGKGVCRPRSLTLTDRCARPGLAQPRLLCTGCSIA